MSFSFASFSTRHLVPSFRNDSNCNIKMAERSCPSAADAVQLVSHACCSFFQMFVRSQIANGQSPASVSSGILSYPGSSLRHANFVHAMLSFSFGSTNLITGHDVLIFHASLSSTRCWVRFRRGGSPCRMMFGCPAVDSLQTSGAQYVCHLHYHESEMIGLLVSSLRSQLHATRIEYVCPTAPGDHERS